MVLPLTVNQLYPCITCLIAFPSQFNWAGHSFDHSRPRREAFSHLSEAVSFCLWRFTLSGDVRGVAAIGSKTELVKGFQLRGCFSPQPPAAPFEPASCFSQAAPTPMTELGGGTNSHHVCPMGDFLNGQRCSTPHRVVQDLGHILHCGLRHFLLYFSPSSLHRIGSAPHSEGFPCPVLPPPPLFFVVIVLQ